MKRSGLRRAAINLTVAERLEYFAALPRPLTIDAPAGDERADAAWDRSSDALERRARRIRGRIHMPLELVCEHRRVDPLTVAACKRADAVLLSEGC
jgi:hypothetical protein